jgi:hypothetical protein
MDEVDFLNNFNMKFIELSKLIDSWDLIKVNSKSEFNKLTEKILSKLYEGQTEITIERIIESELCVTYGLYVTEFDTKLLAKEIMKWWNE